MIFIDLTGKKPPQDWLDKARKLTDELLAAPEGERHKIIDKNSGVWTELKEFLSGISHSKCWYSESKDAFSHCHIDHFRPKKEVKGLDSTDPEGYWWLAFDWKNYRFCGGAGNVRKNSYFAVLKNQSTAPSIPIEDEVIFLLDPTNIDDPEKLVFEQDGKVKPSNAESTSFYHRQAEYTIRHINLNFGPLMEARKVTWNKCHYLLEEIEALKNKNPDGRSVALTQKMRDKMLELKELMQPSSAFSATARCCVLSYPHGWAARLLG